MAFCSRSTFLMSSFFKKNIYIYIYIYIYIFHLWLRWVIIVHRLSLVAAGEGYSLAAVCRLFLAVASLAVEHGL